MKKIYYYIFILIITLTMVSCENVSNYSDEDHYNNIKSIVKEKYLYKEDNKVSFFMYPLYDENEEISYYLIKFYYSGYMYVKIDKEDNENPYKIPYKSETWSKYKYVYNDANYAYPLIHDNDYIREYELDSSNNVIEYNESPYEVADVLDQKLYLLKIHELSVSDILVPAIKSGEKFINLVSMEEFYYLPFYPQNRIPYLNLNFTKPL